MENMSPGYFPVVHSIADPTSLLAKVLVEYDIGQTLDCIFLTYGLNDTYLVRTTGDSYILRVYRAQWRSLEEIHYELDLLQHLGHQGVPVSTPVTRKDGRWLDRLCTPEGERHVALFTYAPGRELHRDSHEQRLQYGRAVAAIHNASDAYTSPHSRFHLDLAHLMEQPLTRVLSFLAHRQEDQTYLQTLAEKLRAGLSALPTDQLDYGFCHGDCHGGNAHITADHTVVTFFDFDCGGPGWRAYDLAVFRWGCARAEQHDRWDSFLQGYQAGRPLSPLDLQAVPWMVALRHFWFLGSEARCTQHVGRGWMNDAYFDRQLRFLKAWETHHLPPSV